LDLFTAMTNQQEVMDFGSFLSDGLHFNPAGHDFVGDQIFQAIDKYFPELTVHPDPATGQPNNSGSSCQALPSSGPYHDDINHKEWEEAFDG
jgi:hypothetical protein